MFEIVVPPDALRAAALPNALDHRGVVLFVRKDNGSLEELHQSGKRRFVRNIAGGEEQRRFLAMQVGEFRFKLHVEMRCARDIARAAGSGSCPINSRMHCAKDRRVLPMPR